VRDSLAWSGAPVPRHLGIYWAPGSNFSAPRSSTSFRHGDAVRDRKLVQLFPPSPAGMLSLAIFAYGRPLGKRARVDRLVA
jgi:hypothetical protein